MNKGEFVRRLSDRMGYDDDFTRAFLDATLDEIRAAVAGGETVSIERFGIFEPSHRAPRSGRNIRTGELMRLPATTVPAFRASKTFKDMVKTGGDEEKGR